jgi:hypothetical protein
MIAAHHNDAEARAAVSRRALGDGWWAIALPHSKLLVVSRLTLRTVPEGFTNLPTLGRTLKSLVSHQMAGGL